VLKGTLAILYPIVSRCRLNTHGRRAF